MHMTASINKATLNINSIKKFTIFHSSQIDCKVKHGIWLYSFEILKAYVYMVDEFAE